MDSNETKTRAILKALELTRKFYHTLNNVEGIIIEPDSSNALSWDSSNSSNSSGPLKLENLIKKVINL